MRNGRRGEGEFRKKGREVHWGKKCRHLTRKKKNSRGQEARVIPVRGMTVGEGRRTRNRIPLKKAGDLKIRGRKAKGWTGKKTKQRVGERKERLQGCWGEKILRTFRWSADLRGESYGKRLRAGNSEEKGGKGIGSRG